MNNNLTSTNQNAKIALNKSKNLLNITSNLLLRNTNNHLFKSFHFKPYLTDTFNCSTKSVAVTPDGKTIISVSEDNTIKSWDVKSGEHINTLDIKEYEVSSLAITPDGKSIIIGSEKGTIDLCEINTGKYIRSFNDTRNSGSISLLGISSSGKYLISISDYDYEKENYDEEEYDTLSIWDIESGWCIKTFNFDVHAITIHKEYFVSSISYYDLSNYPIEQISICDIESGGNIIDFLEGYAQNHSTKVNSLTITPDGKTLISSGGDNQETISLWLGYYEELEEGDEEIYFDVPDGDEIIKLWDITKSRYIKTLEGHTDRVYSLAVTPDGKNIVSGSRDNTIKIWDIQNGECIRTLKGHTDAVHSVITQDGKTIISRSRDNTIKTWDIQSGECNYTIYNIENGSTITMFSDGSFNAGRENIDKFIRIDDSTTSCRKLTKEEIEYFCKVKYENKNKIPEIDIDEDEIPF